MEHPMRRREVVVQPDIGALVPAWIAAYIRVFGIYKPECYSTCKTGFFVLLYVRLVVE
jgi:hypothetical protein